MIKGNKLERNYRKGLDSHDALDFIAEENNILDNRLHGFAYENRQYPVAYIRLVNNTIHFDGTFVLERDENVAEGAQLDLIWTTIVRAVSVSRLSSNRGNNG